MGRGDKQHAVIPDYERAKELARKDPNGTVPYDEHVIYSVGDLTSIAEEIDVETLFKNPGKLYKDENGYFKSVKKMTVSAETRRKQLEHIQDEIGIGIPYQAYPWQYVGWAPREAFRNKVIELGGGIKPVITIGGDKLDRMIANSGQQGLSRQNCERRTTSDEEKN